MAVKENGVCRRSMKDLIDGGKLTWYHLRVFMCCIVSLTFEGYDLVAFGATIPLLLAQWNMSPAYAGFIASYGFGAAVVGAIIGGALGDRWGLKNRHYFGGYFFLRNLGVCLVQRSANVCGIPYCYRNWNGNDATKRSWLGL